MLSDRDILKALDEQTISIEPLNRDWVRGSTIDLTLHDEFLVFRNTNQTHIDVREPFEVTERIKAQDDSFVIHPGEFVLGSTREKVKISSAYSGIIEGRSSLGRIGLIVHATASLVKPGFQGFLTLEMKNVSNLPIRLAVGMRIAQLAFVKLSSPAQHVGGKYLDQAQPAASRIWEDFA